VEFGAYTSAIDVAKENSVARAGHTTQALILKESAA